MCTRIRRSRFPVTRTWLLLANLKSWLGQQPYKIELTQKLKVNGQQQRRVFAERTLDHLATNWMNGHVNTENYRIRTGGLIGHPFLENDVGQAVTLNKFDFQFFGLNWIRWTTPTSGYKHTGHATLDILHEQFQGMVISRGDVKWPACSFDLTPLDFSCGVFLSCKSMRINHKSQRKNWTVHMRFIQ